MRLPQPAPGTGKWWVIGTVGILASVALVVWFGLTLTLGKPTWQTVSYSVKDATSVSVRFQVYRTPGTPLNCTVQALAQDYSVVGSKVVAIPVTQAEAYEGTVDLRTTSLAVTGIVKTCTPP